MWMINPKLLCRKHLLGEHSEIHKHKPSFLKQHKIKGRIFPIVLIEPAMMKIRHDQLAEEMIKRNYNHKSPYEMPDLSYLPENQTYAKVDIKVSLKELKNRCKDCKENIEKELKND